MNECKHGLAEDTCTICKHRSHRPEPDLGPVINASFEGFCPGCNLPIYVGQLIRRCNGWYGHAGCV